MNTTLEQFIKSQIDEWGFEYVENMLNEFGEPRLINGRWYWYVLDSRSNNDDSDNTMSSLHCLRDSVRVLA